MNTKLKIGFAGFSNTAKAYRNAIDKFENLSYVGAYLFSDNDDSQNGCENIFDNFQNLLNSADIICFFGEKIQRKYIADAIRALKNIFIDDYSCILNDNIETLCKLADEADVATQVSMPKMYYWNINEIIKTYKNISYISIDKTIAYNNQRTIVDIYPEIIAAIKITDSEIVSAHCKRTSLIASKSELLQVDFDFLNGINANIKANPCGFYENHELAIVAEKNLALIDLRKREWHNLLYKTSNSEPTKEMFNLDEVPFVERDELSNLIHSIESKTEPFVSLKTIRSLWKCIGMMKNN